jgi:polyvinyl alcohol dehydrogenase (cytochrome)
MYTHDPTGSRVNPDESLLSPAVVGQLGLGVQWRFSTPAAVTGTPAVVGNMVFDGDYAGNFYALRDTPFGPVEAWHRNVGAPIADSPLVLRLPGGESEVIFGDLAGNVWGLEAADGAVNWTAHPNGTYAGMAIYGSAAPIQVSNTTYVAIGVASLEEDVPISPTHPRLTSRGSVALLDPVSGGVVWQTYTITDSESAAGSSGASVWSTPTYDAATGRIYVTTGNNFSGPATPTGDAILALDARTGAILWDTQGTMGDVSQTINDQNTGADADFGDSAHLFTLPGGTRAVGAGEKTGVYFIVNAATGALINKVPLETAGPFGGLFPDSAVDQQAGLILANGIDWPNPLTNPVPTKGDLFALSLDGSQVAWDFPTPASPNFTGVAVADGVVYFQSLVDGTLYAINEKTGALLARVMTAGSSGGPAVADGRLFEGTGFAFGTDQIGVKFPGSIIAVGPRLFGPPIDLGTALAEAQNVKAIATTLAVELGGAPPTPGQTVALLLLVAEDVLDIAHRQAIPPATLATPAGQLAALVAESFWLDLTENGPPGELPRLLELL